jgi:hypothetical protein
MCDDKDIVGSPVRCSVSAGNASSLEFLSLESRVEAGNQFKCDVKALDKAGNLAVRSFQGMKRDRKEVNPGGKEGGGRRARVMLVDRSFFEKRIIFFDSIS